jgi:hypothetical protein
MHPTELARRRLYAQRIYQANFTSAEETVAWMGAMQAQDYQGALWSIGLRTPSLTRKDVEQAIIDRTIVRTWPMRGTLHFLAATDARWIVALLAPRALAAAAGRRKQLEIDDAVIAKSRQILTSALSGGKCLTRAAVCALLDKGGVATTGQRGIHILHYFAELGLLCFGPHEGKQPTFVLMDEWLPATPTKEKEEALCELAKRYFKSHGPASLRDFIGWAHLTVVDARLGLELAKPELIHTETEGVSYWFDGSNLPAPARTYLLPGFDEYMLGYKNRLAALPSQFANRIVPGNNGMFISTLVIDGQVAGTWKRTTRKTSQLLTLLPFKSLTNADSKSIEPAIKRYKMFSSLPTTWQIAP